MAARRMSTAGATRTRHRVKQRLKNHRNDPRVQHELKEMQETQDLREIDDDVENVATLLEWHAPEHNHQPKSQRWFIILAVATTLLIGFFLFFFNFISAITTALIGGILYYIAQREPAVMRYRVMVDGVAINNTLYHYRDLAAFNIVYQPGHSKTVIVRSQRRFAPLIHLEIGDANPVPIRDVLLQFLPEDQDLQEPLVDLLARRLGF